MNLYKESLCLTLYVCCLLIPFYLNSYCLILQVDGKQKSKSVTSYYPLSPINLFITVALNSIAYLLLRESNQSIPVSLLIVLFGHVFPTWRAIRLLRVGVTITIVIKIAKPKRE
ncbi:hypothetical protein DFJ63DRAFT_312643 [Scheffersomyces coipomensis]|uniref:uncharacterized protein n=1 Tax=Scheffersomyces coipomensis TaxID=1788519 RepID=UPI00315D041B